MKLTLKDRVLILNAVLPQFDTRKNMELKIAINSKISISEIDQKRIVTNDLGGGQVNIGFTDATAISEEVDISLTDEELMYLKQRVLFIDRNGMFSEFTISTYTKIMDTRLINDAYQKEWDKMQGIVDDIIPPATDVAQTK